MSTNLDTAIEELKTRHALATQEFERIRAVYASLNEYFRIYAPVVYYRYDTEALTADERSARSWVMTEAPTDVAVHVFHETPPDVNGHMTALIFLHPWNNGTVKDLQKELRRVVRAYASLYNDYEAQAPGVVAALRSRNDVVVYTNSKGTLSLQPIAGVDRVFALRFLSDAKVFSAFCSTHLGDMCQLPKVTTLSRLVGTK